MKRLFLAAVVSVSLAAAQSASAHATLVRVVPADGSVLTTAPRAVRVQFDDGVRIGKRNAAVANSGGSVLAGPPRLADRGRTLVLPLRRLAGGDYSVRWSAVSDDGHEEEGVLAFAVGAGRAPPAAVLTAHGIVTWQRVLMRTLFFLGALGAFGGTVFALAVWRPLRAATDFTRANANVLFLFFLLAFLGGSGLVHATSVGGTRFERVLEVATTAALVGGAAAALTPVYRRLAPVTWAAAAVLAASPTLAGHALDADQPHLVSVPVDLVHLATAGTWLGGLAALAFVVPRATDDELLRARAARRFSTLALAAVVLVAASGVGRALTELSAVSQLWSTAYGRAILVKTALFLPLLGLGWLNRSVLLDAFARLRRSVLVELTLLTAVVVAVGVLTDERPGRVKASAAEAALAPARTPEPPPPGTFVDGRELGRLAVALAVGDRSTVTVVGQDGTGVDGLAVAVDGKRATPCGSGCYRAPASRGQISVAVGERATTFTVPSEPRPAPQLLARVTKAYRALRSVEYVERLSSSPSVVQVSHFRVQAPNRLAYRIRGGPEAIVIGARRWDREPGKDWVLSPQTPLRVPATYWGATARNAYRAGANELTFVDPRLPAWFRVRYDPRTGRPLELHMTAAAHFMTESYSGFDRPLEISPPSR